MQPTPYGAPQGYQAPGSNPAQAAGIILIVCAVAIAIGTFTKSWISESHGDSSMGIGLLGMRSCYDGECNSMSWGDMGKGVDADIKALGYLGILGGLAAAGLCVTAAAMALGRNSRKISTPLFIGLISGGGGVQLIWFIRIMTEIKGDSSPGYSAFLGLGGATAAVIIFAAMLAPIIRRERGGAAPYGAGPMYGAPMGMPMGQPMQQPMMQQPMGQPMMQQPMGQPMQQPMIMACPRCHGPTQFVAQYQRHFCPACQQYA